MRRSMAFTRVLCRTSALGFFLLSMQAQAQTAACDGRDEVLHEYSASGSSVDLTVPARVYRAHVTLNGGPGGYGGAAFVDGGTNAPGNRGIGGQITGFTLALPGSTWQLWVGANGGRGESTESQDPSTNVGGPGGFGYTAGGDGGSSVPGGGFTFGAGGGGGGGSTALVRGGLLIAEAPGGGGGGGEAYGAGIPGDGGNFGSNGGDGGDGVGPGGQGGDGGDSSGTDPNGGDASSLVRAGAGGGGGGGRYAGEGGNDGGQGGGGGAGASYIGLVSQANASAGSPFGQIRICFAAPKYDIGGSAAGQTGSVVLRLSADGEASQQITVPQGASSFEFPEPIGAWSNWQVRIISQPPGQPMVVTPDRGKVAREDIGYLRLRPARVCRVISSGSFGVADGKDGSNWTGQARTLHAALADNNCNEIWVKAGVYTPTTVASPTTSFRVSRNMRLYGGFAGTETALDQRQLIAANRTVLSGDLEANDDNNNADGNSITETATEIAGTNARVMFIDGTTASGPITPSTLIDGFVITGGDTVNPENGGALYCNGINSNNACNPTLSSVSFVGNHSGNNGGAMFNNGGSSDAESSPVLVNVSFSGNQANDRGGAIYNDGRNDGLSSPQLLNVTISNNGSTSSSWALYNDAFNNNHPYLGSFPLLDHVLLWNNASGASSGVSRRGINAVVMVRYSLMPGGCGAIAGADCGSPNTNLNADPLLGALADNGGLTPTLLPGVGSPAIDGGHADACADIDQRGFARPQDSDINGSIRCDIGAVEIDAPGLILGVTLDGNGSGEVNAGAAPAPVGGTIVDCGAGGTCYANYANGSQVTLTATASSGSEFTGWGGGLQRRGHSQQRTGAG